MARDCRRALVRIRARSRFSIRAQAKPPIRSSSGWPASTETVSNCLWQRAMSWNRRPRAPAARNAFRRRHCAGFSMKRRRSEFGWVRLRRASQRGLRPRERLASRSLLARREDAGQHAVKLFDREVLADVTVGASSKRGMHPLFVIADASKDDDREGLAHFADE